MLYVGREENFFSFVGSRARMHEVRCNRRYKIVARTNSRMLQQTLLSWMINAQNVAARMRNVHKRYLLTVAAFNLSILMRKLIGVGTPKGAAAIPWGLYWASNWGRVSY